MVIHFPLIYYMDVQYVTYRFYYMLHALRLTGVNQLKYRNTYERQCTYVVLTRQKQNRDTTSIGRQKGDCFEPLGKRLFRNFLRHLGRHFASDSFVKIRIFYNVICQETIAPFFQLCICISFLIISTSQCSSRCHKNGSSIYQIYMRLCFYYPLD